MKRILKKSWWVVLAIGIFSFIYLHGMQDKALLLKDLQARLQGLEREKLLAKQQNEELLMEIESQSDPAWIELRLMEELGMTPKGATKIYFDHQ
ncbi:MAG: hypothetical protein JSR58_07530 [Verrucomicrobia bacterium]|nr:hypothetical protein [Verrucomicrobiota bacterium]